MNWKETTPDFKQFEAKGETLEGELLGFNIIQIKGVNVRRWQLRRLSDGIAVGFLGGVSLDATLDAVPVGTTIKLEYEGKVKLGSGYHVKKFKLYEQAADAPEKSPEKSPDKPKKK
jgi:hypothetical protein